MNFCRYRSPLGTLLLAGTGDTLHAIRLPHGNPGAEPAAEWQETPAAFGRARQQLDQYFAGQRREFDLAIAPTGTPFQRAVLEALRAIPYGETRSYADIAGALGRPRAVRAVGAANRRNPLPIVIPCHRVVGADGSLTGFAGGLRAKALLLDLEAAAIADRRACGTAQ